MTEKLFNEIAAWQQDTFPTGTPDSTLHHLLDEIKELRHALRFDWPNSKEELADCMFLIFGCADRMGMSYQDIQEAISQKFEKNKARTWGKPDDNGVVKHIEPAYTPSLIATPGDGAVIVEGVKEKTVGELITAAINLHELTPETVETELKFPSGHIRKIMNNEVYPNSVPIILLRNLLWSLHIKYWDIEPCFMPTYKLLKSKETTESLSEKPAYYLLWENEEALYKYTSRLMELMTSPPESNLPSRGNDALMEELKKSEIN